MRVGNAEDLAKVLDGQVIERTDKYDEFAFFRIWYVEPPTKCYKIGDIWLERI